MRIAQVSPLHESVPPKLYGGTERVVSFLTDALIALGHEVTLFASGDSCTRAELIPCAARGLRLDGSHDQVACHLNMIEEVRRRAHEFDVIHLHVDYFGLPLARLTDVPSVSTMHARMDTPDWEPLFRRYADAPLVSISDAQRAPLPSGNWRGTVYHGLPSDLLSLQRRPGQYLAFLGRFSREKRVDRAIEIARQVGMPLRIAAKLDDKDRKYYQSEVEPLLQGRDDVELVGEIDEDHKQDFLGNAAALLFPIDWPEPFGLVMIEAMACGTPVIAFRCGAIPEVMRDGVSGYIVDSLDEAVARTRDALRIPRERCRAYFDERFLSRRMAQDYVAVYEDLIARGLHESVGGGAAGSLAAIDAEEHLEAGETGADLGPELP